MRANLRLIVSLVVSITFISLLFTAYQVRTESRVRRDELGRRARMLAEKLRAAIEQLPPQGSEQSLRRIVEGFGNPELPAAIVIYSTDGNPVLMSADASPADRDESASTRQERRARPGSGDALSGSAKPKCTFILCRW